jgi:hypothetical protein
LELELLARVGIQVLGSFVGSVSLFCESLRASTVLIRDASVFVFTPANSLFEATHLLSGTVLLMILYGTPKAEAQEPALVRFPSIAIGNLGIPDGGVWRY